MDHKITDLLPTPFLLFVIIIRWSSFCDFHALRRVKEGKRGQTKQLPGKRKKAITSGLINFLCHQTYLSKYTNVFVQIEKCIFQNCREKERKQLPQDRSISSSISQLLFLLRSPTHQRWLGLRNCPNQTLNHRNHTRFAQAA